MTKQKEEEVLKPELGISKEKFRESLPNLSNKELYLIFRVLTDQKEQLNVETSKLEEAKK
jgi:hypothetical protein